jgi:hypothetical protein
VTDGGPHGPSPGARFLGVVDAAAVLVCAALAAIYLTPEVVDRDEAIFAASAYRADATGLPLYQATWDLKPPGVFWVHRVARWISSSEPVLAAHALGAAVWVATAVLVGLVARRGIGRAAFAPAVVAYALLRSSGGWKAGAANAEAFLQLPLAGAIVLLAAGGGATTWRRSLAGGALLGVAAVFKAPALLFGPACVAAALVGAGPRAAWRAAAGGAAGAVAVIALVVLHAAARGDLEGFLLCNVEANRLYVAHGPETTPGLWFGAFGAELARAPAPWALAVAGLCGWAMSRSRALTPAAPGRDGRQDFEYRRNGTRCLFACFDVGSGRVLGRCTTQRKRADFQSFLDLVASAYPQRRVHVVLDNLNTHSDSKQGNFISEWNRAHGDRFVFHYTLTHGSWLNQVELWLGVVSRRVLRYGTFRSPDELVQAIPSFIEVWNRTEGHPFRWTYRGRPLVS